MSFTKEDLVDSIKSWVNIDKEISVLQHEIKVRKTEKKRLSSALLKTMKENEIDFFNINDGKILHTTRKVKAPLSKKHLQECLHNFFSDKDQNVAEELSEYIMKSRAINIKENIKLKSFNNKK